MRIEAIAGFALRGHCEPEALHCSRPSELFVNGLDVYINIEMNARMV